MCQYNIMLEDCCYRRQSNVSNKVKLSFSVSMQLYIFTDAFFFPLLVTEHGAWEYLYRGRRAELESQFCHLLTVMIWEISINPLCSVSPPIKGR